MPRRKGQRHAEPFWFSRAKAYYVRLNKQMIRLSADRDKAWQMYYEIRASRNTDQWTITVNAVVEKFLEYCEGRLNRGDMGSDQFEYYGRYLAMFCSQHGSLLCSQLQGSHVREWLEKTTDSRDWGKSSIAAAVKSIRRCFRWAANPNEGGLLKSNPIEGIKAVEPAARDVVVSSDTHTAMMAATDDVFKLVLDALSHTGCRPGEICKITEEHVIEGKLWLLKDHKTKRTGKSRVVQLTEHMQDVTARLILKREPGQHLFLNARGRPWTPNAIRSRIDRLQKKLKLPNVFAYAYRHTAASNMILEGVDIVTVAHLLGTSTQMIMKNYGHLLLADDELRQAQEKAIRKNRKKTG